MYERFTDRARKVMQLASSEALRLNHPSIGTEHILLGLLKEGGVVGGVFEKLGVSKSSVELELATYLDIGFIGECQASGKLPQTPKAKMVVEYAVNASRGLGHNYVGTEHLLLGLVCVEGLAGVVLGLHGLNATNVRKAIQELTGSKSDDTFSQGVLAVANKISELLETLPTKGDMYEAMVLAMSHRLGRMHFASGNTEIKDK